ncbi:MAG: B12-binding domain-containing radical SAM protein, partial [Bacteroidetes bacterium]|nr:B12-binding domain-containing radical SAM protein [Bacteroidota bacterium]
YTNDPVVKQLIAIDYYLQHKVKPKILYRNEYEMSDKIKLIDKFKLNHHKYRFVIMPINFDFQLWESNNIISKGVHDIIIQYTGTNKASVIKIQLENA